MFLAVHIPMPNSFEAYLKVYPDSIKRINLILHGMDIACNFLLTKLMLDIY